MKNLFISELLLLSLKEKKAKQVVFDRKRTLIHGKNHTGKSSLIKSIYRTFGAEPLVNPRFLDANVITLVRFEVDRVKYEILRDGKTFAIYDSEGSLLKRFDSVTTELAPYLSKVLDFHPLFQSKSGEFIIPPPAFLFLPYYVDQDESWSKSWSSFKKLEQIRDNRNQGIFYHSGVRPNEYYQTKKELEQYLSLIEETDRERKLTTKIIDDVKEKLTQTQFNIDVDAFKEEIKELLTTSELLRKKEDKLRSQLLSFYNLKVTLESQIDIVKLAIIESNKDLKYASQNLASHIDCPTCGAEYENSFTERFEIASDELKSKELLIELTREASEVDERIKSENEQLTNATAEVAKIEALLQEKRGKVQLKDVIDSAGKNQVKAIFEGRSRELQAILLENALKKQNLEKKLKAYENKDRKGKILTYYQSKMNEFLKKLDVPSLKSDDYKALTDKIENKETGSSRPRALIAYYFSFFYLMKEFSTSVFCPLIIDSPNQQDQDIEHIDKIMEFINLNQPDESQMILGLAETYDVDFNCKIISLEERYGLLQLDEYSKVYSIIGDRLEQLWFRK